MAGVLLKEDVIHNADKLYQSFNKILTLSMKNLVQCELTSLLQLTHEYLSSTEIDFQCSNFDDFCNKIEPYCNFLHIDLLEHLSKKFNIDLEGESLRHMKDLQKFYQSTQLQHVVHISTSFISSKSNLTLKLSNKWKLLSLHNLVIATKYCFGSKKLFLCNVKDDCGDNIQVKFSVPQSHIPPLLKLAIKNKGRLCQLGVLEVFINGEPCIQKEKEDETPCFEHSSLKAAETGDSLLLLALLELGVSVDYANEQGQTLLMVAVCHEQIQVIHILLSAGANVNLQDNVNKNTALMMACEMNKIDIVNILLKYRSPFLNLQNTKGLTAFMMASACEHTLIVETLRLLQFGDNSARQVTSSCRSIDAPLSSDDDTELDSMLKHISMFEILMKEKSLDVGSALKDIRDQPLDTEEKFGLFRKYVDYRPGLLEVLRQRKNSMFNFYMDIFYQLLGYSSPEQITIKKNFADICELLAGNNSVIYQFCNYLFAEDIIPKAVLQEACNPYRPIIERMTIVFNSILTNLKLDQINVFTQLVLSLKKVGLNNMAKKLVECLSKL